MKIVMALSGGLDSATMLAHLLDQGHDVSCLTFTYGSKHEKYEHAAALDILDHYNILGTHIDLSGIMQSFTSHLLKSGGTIPEGHYNDASMAQTVVPARNIIFLSILAGHAWSVDAQQIAIGIHQGDHAIYADCRAEFYKAMDSAIYLGTDRRVEIVAPLLHLDKAAIVERGDVLNVPFELTRTCYKDQPLACGKCGSCSERLEAFEKNEMIDPAEYERT